MSQRPHPRIRRLTAAALLLGSFGGSALGIAGAPRQAVAQARSAAGAPADLPADTSQIVLGLADTWDATRVTLYRLEARRGQARPNGWTVVGSPIPGRIGPSGLAWGDGLVALKSLSGNSSEDHPEKAEGDGRAPVGVFGLGPVFAYDPAWRGRTTMPVIRVGPNDLFVEDPASPLYNTHVRLDHLPATDWEKRQQMEQNDPAHRLKVFVGHNVDPPVGGRGSAIFLHVWRNAGATVTAGCTAVDYAALRTVVGWLRPGSRPVYVLLTRDMYRTARRAWKLPEIG